MGTERVPIATLATVFAVVLLIEFVVLGIAPLDRSAWVLENVLVVLLVGGLVLTYRRFRFSRISYTCLFLFLVVHEIGSHYTYSEVPYEEFFAGLFGTGPDAWFGWERNHFDRAVHLLYGLLIAYPIREVTLRIVDARGVWGYVLPLMFTMATSMIYELIEWGAALTFGGELGAAYLGTQGDVWDAHIDMALASLGAALTMLLVLAMNVFLQRDFAAAWAESCRVKSSRPMGEEALDDPSADRPL